LIVLLSIWYPETYEINKYLNNKDFIIAAFEQNLFGLQPALRFHKILPQMWFSEIMNFGYLAYYPIIVFTSLYFYLTNKLFFKYFLFMLLFSFYAYYIIYILFPTVGPQYYYCAIGAEHVQNGIFPNLYNYFKFHSELNCQQYNKGFFLSLVEASQLSGERPTAAFPSSHVGITTLIMLLLFQIKEYKIIVFLIPIYIALVTATVYIQAHYLLDLFAGFVSSFALYFSGKYFYKRFNLKENIR
jgi:membrane-associated phospholipid phosphatase